MGKILKPKKPKIDTRAQDSLIKAQQKQLADERARADAETARLKTEREDSMKRLRTRLSGRRSLIATSELGVTDQLG